MSLLLSTERSLKRYLLGSAAWLVSGTGTYIVEEDGIRITLGNGFRYHLGILTGQGAAELTGPAVVCSCPSGTHVESGTRTMRVDVVIELHYPVDESHGLRHPLHAFEYAAAQLAQALYRHDFPQLLSAAESGFTVLYAPGTWTEESGFTDRMRTYRFRRQLIVAPTDFPSEPVTARVRYGLSASPDFVEVSAGDGDPSWDNVTEYVDATMTLGQPLTLGPLDPGGTPKYLLIALPEAFPPLAAVTSVTGEAIPMAGLEEGFGEVSGGLHYKVFHPTGDVPHRAWRSLGTYDQPLSVRLT